MVALKQREAHVTSLMLDPHLASAASKERVRCGERQG